jgi:hypothetical protein
MSGFRLRLCLALAACAVGAGAVGCDLLDDEGVSTALDDAAEEVREGGEANATVDLREMTDFAWDRVVFFGSYPDRAEIERRLGFTWAEANEELTSGEQDRFLVFTDGDRVAKVIKYPFREGRANLQCVIADEDGYQRSESVFRLVEIEDPAAVFYVLVPAGLDAAERAEFVSACGFGA